MDKRVAVVHAMMVDIKAVTDKLRTEHFRPNMDHLLAILCVLQLDLPALHVPSPAIIMHWAYAAMAWRGKPTHIVMIARQKHWGHVGATMTETAHLIDEKRDRTIEEMIAPTSNVLSPVARNGLFLGAALSTSDLALYTSIDVAVQESNWSADGVTSMVAGRRASRTIFLDDEVRPARFMWPIDSRRCSRVFAFCHVGCML